MKKLFIHSNISKGLNFKKAGWLLAHLNFVAKLFLEEWVTQ